MVLQLDSNDDNGRRAALAFALMPKRAVNHFQKDCIEVVLVGKRPEKTTVQGSE